MKKKYDILGASCFQVIFVLFVYYYYYLALHYGDIHIFNFLKAFLRVLPFLVYIAQNNYLL